MGSKSNKYIKLDTGIGITLTKKINYYLKYKSNYQTVVVCSDKLLHVQEKHQDQQSVVNIRKQCLTNSWVRCRATDKCR